MPPIYKLDDYKACLQESSDRYCTVEINLISDTESELLNMIQEYSEQTLTHYNHSKLTYGICVTQRCQKYVQDRKLVSKTTLEACLNDTFMKEYSLSTQVTDFNCYSTSDAKEEFDTADQAVAIVLLLILMLNVFGSVYDLRNRNKLKENSILLCFSTPRNWRRLTSYQNNSDVRMKYLKGLNGIRCLILMGVIMVHCSWPFARAVQNSHDLELMYYNLRQNVLLSGSLAIQSNILISGFLLAYNMEIFSENNRIRWYILPKNILLRYFRLTPVYAVVIAVSGTWVKHVERGPLWQVSANYVFSHCRSEWWRNLLYINNYKYCSLCIMPTWYLALDMQLYCLGIILCVLLKKKRWRKPVLTSVLVLGILVTAVHTYLRDLDAIFIVAPQQSRELFATHATFNETYKMGHTNIPSFIIGMMAGYSVYRFQKAGLDVSKNKKLRYLYWVLVPLGAAVMLSGEVFYRDAPRDSLTVRVIYAAVSKPAFATVMALLVAGTIFRTDNLYRKVLEWDIWTVPSRLSYCVTIVNFVFLNLYVGMIRSLLVINNVNLLLLTLGVTVVSFIAAVPLWLLIENPFTEVAKYYFGTQQKQLAKND